MALDAWRRWEGDEHQYTMDPSLKAILKQLGRKKSQNDDYSRSIGED